MKVKCNARTYVFQVGSEKKSLEYHPACDGFPVEVLNEPFGLEVGRKQFGEAALLVEMVDTVHYVDKPEPPHKIK